MKLPKSIKVGQHTYRIRSGRGHDTILDGEDSLGSCTKTVGVIRVHTGLGQSQRRETVLHEVLHAAFDLTAVRGHEHEEDIVASLAPYLLSALRDNPTLVAFLLADD